ncbi:unnamed protein product, partial [Staurois parvus]
MGPLCLCPNSKKVYEKGTRGISWGPLLTPGPRAVPEFPNGLSAPGWDHINIKTVHISLCGWCGCTDFHADSQWHHPHRCEPRVKETMEILI